ncbi:MAG TPA: extracellular solute-binding protein [Nitrososphaeraceae archaeon]
MLIITIIICSSSILSLTFGKAVNGDTIASSPTKMSENKKQVILTAMLTDLSEPKRWQFLFQPSLEELRKRHPDLDIQINYSSTYPYGETRAALLNALGNKSAIDLISVDQIWLGELANRGFLADLTNRAASWGRLSDWYQANLDGSLYNDKIYGIWAWTDVLGIWYWKDMLSKSGVNPSSLMTWDGYLAAAKKINNTLSTGQGEEGKENNTIIQAMHINGDINSPDRWYPYLWMLGGAIVEMRPGHPTKDFYWFPAYNSSDGAKALEFLKEQIDIGLKAQSCGCGNQDSPFVERKFAVMLSGSWMPSYFQDKVKFEQSVGFLPVFPVPDKSIQSATMMGGWALSIPSTSQHKDLAWELITIILDPKILAPWLQRYGYLPTQASIGEGPFSSQLQQSIPYYKEMVSMIDLGWSRPSIPEYSQIAQHIKQALDEVYSGLKEPKQALDDAAAKSAKVLGWQ